MSQASIAAVLIVKNEAENLGPCLETVKEWVDEIVILDSGSSDNTESIAREYTDKYFTNDNWQGYGRQRQIAQKHVSSDWILWLDADERVTPELRQNIQSVLAENRQGLYSIPRLSWVFGRFIRHCGWYPDRVIRLYPTMLTGYNDAMVHEKVEIPQGQSVIPLKGDLLHYTYRDLNHYLTKSAYYAKMWAEQRQKRGKKSSLSQGIGHAIGCFMKMYFLKAGFLDGKQGFLLSVLSAHSTFVKYADLWIRSTTEPPEA
ncbi:glycosyltransferase family 2 protein [Dongshaea marina]|uniref:glycosyltransferase family 2 protein n=1 Tax=Dongshaea marina TaxID=2047966 RepID=UPI000D3ECEC9|nr:glycosyltransferase family 2 protein [Dongshaea marina]